MFEQITSFDNLYASYKAAGRGKHDRKEVLRYDLHAEKIIWQLQQQLRDGSYQHGKYRTFQVCDPKLRDVSAAPFNDRVVHHAIVRGIEPIFERIFVYDSYACRIEKGTHATVLRLQHFLRSAQDKYGEFYVLRTDIAKFFASVDHAILLNLLAEQIHDPKTLGLTKQIIDSYHEPFKASAHASSIRGSQMSLELGLPPILDQGLLSKQLAMADSSSFASESLGQPIGNLTSQLFANIYLNHLDQFVKHTLGECFYLRYMDDILIIHFSKAHLDEVKVIIEHFVRDELALKLNKNKTNVHKFVQRERFVGYEAELFVRRLSKPTVQRFLRRLKKTYKMNGEIAARASWAQFDAYASFAHAQGLLKAINPFDNKA